MKHDKGLNILASAKEEAFKKQCLQNAKRRDERMALKEQNKPETKNILLHLKVTPTMDKQIKERAVCLGLNVSDYIRNLIEEDLKNEL